MNAPRDPDRLIHAFLQEGQTELADPVYDAVRATIEQKRQRTVIGPWRMPTMNKIVPIGIGVAAVVVALVVGSQLLGRSAPSGPAAAPAATPSPTPQSTPVPTPSPTIWTGLPEGPFVVAGSPVKVTVGIASPGWSHAPELSFVGKNDDGLDAPDTVGGALIAWAWPAGTRFNVYGDSCQWSTTIPATPATTPEEIAVALAAQAPGDATAPADVTIGGYPGKTITLEVPMSYEKPGATREEEFGECDQDIFGFYGLEGGTEPERNAQGPGQVDELWILDVNGAIVILDATYGPATPATLVEEMRTMAKSATFE